MVRSAKHPDEREGSDDSVQAACTFPDLDSCGASLSARCFNGAAGCRVHPQRCAKHPDGCAPLFEGELPHKSHYVDPDAERPEPYGVTERCATPGHVHVNASTITTDNGCTLIPRTVVDQDAEDAAAFDRGYMAEYRRVQLRDPRDETHGAELPRAEVEMVKEILDLEPTDMEYAFLVGMVATSTKGLHQLGALRRFIHDRRSRLGLADG